MPAFLDQRNRFEMFGRNESDRRSNRGNERRERRRQDQREGIQRLDGRMVVMIVVRALPTIRQRSFEIDSVQMRMHPLARVNMPERRYEKCQ